MGMSVPALTMDVDSLFQRCVSLSLGDSLSFLKDHLTSTFSEHQAELTRLKAMFTDLSTRAHAGDQSAYSTLQDVCGRIALLQRSSAEHKVDLWRMAALLKRSTGNASYEERLRAIAGYNRGTFNTSLNNISTHEGKLKRSLRSLLKVRQDMKAAAGVTHLNFSLETFLSSCDSASDINRLDENEVGENKAFCDPNVHVVEKCWYIFGKDSPTVQRFNHLADH